MFFLVLTDEMMESYECLKKMWSLISRPYKVVVKGDRLNPLKVLTKKGGETRMMTIVLSFFVIYLTSFLTVSFLQGLFQISGGNTCSVADSSKKK